MFLIFVVMGLHEHILHISFLHQRLLSLLSAIFAGECVFQS
jgi:hypothetical protein